MTTTDLISPDEIVLAPDDYDLPPFTPGWAKGHQEKMKQTVTVTRKQIQFFGERGVPWTEIEKFYNVGRLTLMRWYLADYEKGIANTNIKLRSKMVELALTGHPTMLIWLGKQRLQMSDAGPTEDSTGETTSHRPTKIEVTLVKNEGADRDEIEKELTKVISKSEDQKV